MTISTPAHEQHYPEMELAFDLVRDGEAITNAEIAGRLDKDAVAVAAGFYTALEGDDAGALEASEYIHNGSLVSYVKAPPAIALAYLATQYPEVCLWIAKKAINKD